MDVFNGVRFVRLRCCARRGKYLAADPDGSTVILTSQRGVHNAVWAVHHASSADGGPCVLLRGAAYGRYLVATTLQASSSSSAAATGLLPSSASHHGAVVTAQAKLPDSSSGGDGGGPPAYPAGMLWQAIPRRSAFVLRSGTGRYLRANGRYLRWRRAVTSAGDTGSSMLLWDVENVPVRFSRPSILDPIFQLTRGRRRAAVTTESEVAREVRYVRGESDGSVNEGAWRTMRVSTHNLMQLRLTLACRLGASRDVTRTTLCVRAGGPHAHLSPLLVDLPLGNDRVDIVIVTHGTQADNELRYPDLHAPRVLDSSKVADKCTLI